MKTLTALSIAFGLGSAPLVAEVVALPAQTSSSSITLSVTDREMMSARSLLASGQKVAAAKRIYRIVDGLHKSLLYADVDNPKKVIRVSNRLERVAQKVESGKLDSASRLNREFLAAKPVIDHFYAQVRSADSHDTRQVALSVNK